MRVDPHAAAADGHSNNGKTRLGAAENVNKTGQKKGAFRGEKKGKDRQQSCHVLPDLLVLRVQGQARLLYRANPAFEARLRFKGTPPQQAKAVPGNTRSESLTYYMCDCV